MGEVCARAQGSRKALPDMVCRHASPRQKRRTGVTHLTRFAFHCTVQPFLYSNAVAIVIPLWSCRSALRPEALPTQLLARCLWHSAWIQDGASQEVGVIPYLVLRE